MEIYNLSNPKELLGNIDSLTSIAKALLEFESKTGVSIDEYGNTRLYIDHLKLLVQLIDTECNWKEVFQTAIKNNHSLLIVGD